MPRRHQSIPAFDKGFDAIAQEFVVVVEAGDEFAARLHDAEVARGRRTSRSRVVDHL